MMMLSVSFLKSQKMKKRMRKRWRVLKQVYPFCGHEPPTNDDFIMLILMNCIPKGQKKKKKYRMHPAPEFSETVGLPSLFYGDDFSSAQVFNLLQQKNEAH